MEKLVKIAENVARYAHTGQKDKAGKDYINHPLAVASFCKTPEQKCVALLHDVIEDTDYSPQELKKQFGEEIYNSVLIVTHRKGETYWHYIKRVKHSGNRTAIAVKKADLKHNSDISRMGKTFFMKSRIKKNVKRWCKYQICRLYLSI